MIYRSKIKVPDVELKWSTLQSSSSLIIFGTGNYGALALHALKARGVTIDGFCDNNETNWGTQFKGHIVISPEELQREYPNATVLLASLRFKYMASQLQSSENIRTLDVDFLFSELDLTGIDASVTLERLNWMLDLYMFAVDSANDTNRIKIKSLDVVVTEKCSLKCKDCSNLMQYYEKPEDNEIALLLDSVQRFMNSIDVLHEARLIGGEPFMYKKLPLVVRQLVSNEKCEKITIFTNGTIIPKGDMLASLKNEKVSLIISDYGKLSKNSSALRALLDKEDIAYISYDVDFWQDCAKIYKRERTDAELAALFGDCCVNDALTLLHGKLYTCPFSAHVTNLQAIPPEYYDDDVDIPSLSDEALKQKIVDLYSGKKFINACSYCAGRDYSVARIEAALQVESPIPIKKFIKIDKATY